MGVDSKSVQFASKLQVGKHLKELELMGVGIEGCVYRPKRGALH